MGSVGPSVVARGCPVIGFVVIGFAVIGFGVIGFGVIGFVEVGRIGCDGGNWEGLGP